VPRILCHICRYAVPTTARIANVLTTYLRCAQGVPGAPYRVECMVFEREPGADDEWTSGRVCGCAVSCRRSIR